MVGFASLYGDKETIFRRGCCQQERDTAANISKLSDGKKAFQSAEKQGCGSGGRVYK